MNENIGSSLFKNIFSLTLGKSVSLVVNVIAIVFVARHLGAEQFGIFSSLLAVIVILSKIIDLGFAPVVFTEYSKKNNFRNFLPNALTIRILMFFVIALFMNCWFALSGENYEKILIANLLLINVIISAKYVNFRELLEIPYKANLKTIIPMAAAILDNFLLLIAVVFIILFDGGLVSFVTVYMLCNIPGFIILIYDLKKNYKISFKPTLSSGKWLLRQSSPIWGYALLNAIYQQIDIVMLESMQSSYSAGVYSIAPRLLTPILIIPGIIVSGFYPLLVRYFEDGNPAYELLKQNVFKILLLVPFLAAVYLTFKIDFFIEIIFGAEYKAADIPSIILFWSQIFLFYAFFVKNITVIHSTQKYNFYESAIVLVINLSVNFILIPIYDVNGAAIAKLAGAFFSFLISIFALYKSDGKVYIFNIRILIWGLFTIVLLFAVSGLNIFFYSMIFIVAVPVLLLVFNFFTNEEIYYLFKIINKPILWNKLNENKLYRFFYKT